MEKNNSDLKSLLKIAPFWDFSLPPDVFFDRVAFAFQMDAWPNQMYVKFKEPYFGMDCFELKCDLDHGLYVNDGDMIFNQYMGERIIDSGVEIDKFIFEWMSTLPIRF